MTNRSFHAHADAYEYRLNGLDFKMWSKCTHINIHSTSTCVNYTCCNLYIKKLKTNSKNPEESIKSQNRNSKRTDKIAENYTTNRAHQSLTMIITK